jgi:hypothetical protein
MGGDSDGKEICETQISNHKSKGCNTEDRAWQEAW